MSPMNGASVPRRDLMDRITCVGCNRSAASHTVKREGWSPIRSGDRILGAVCRRCQDGGVAERPQERSTLRRPSDVDDGLRELND